jgi:hypothetical protein
VVEPNTSNTFNPYATLESEARIESVARSGDVAVRFEYLEREATLRLMARVYSAFVFLFGLLVLVLFLYYCFADTTGSDEDFRNRIEELLQFNAWCAAHSIVSIRLHRIVPSAKWDGTIMCFLSLFAVPIGTLLGAYTLYLIWTRDGRFVLSKEYQRVMKSTYYIKHYRANWIWFVFTFISVLASSLTVVWLRLSV